MQTTEIFGQPVFKYTYREAVIEGYLVDHDAPHELKTKLSSEGIHYKQGETVTIYDPVTGEITNSELIDDELDLMWIHLTDRSLQNLLIELFWKKLQRI